MKLKKFKFFIRLNFFIEMDKKNVVQYCSEGEVRRRGHSLDIFWSFMC